MNDNREFIAIAKKGLKKGYSEKKIAKILKKEGFFPDEIENIIFAAFTAYRKEIEHNPSLIVKESKRRNNRLFDWPIFEIPVTILAFLIWPFRIPPSKSMKRFVIFLLIIFVGCLIYFPSLSKKIRFDQKANEMLEQLETIKDLQKTYLGN